MLPGTQLQDPATSLCGMGPALQSLFVAASCLCAEDCTLLGWVSAGMQWHADVLPAAMRLLAHVSSPRTALILFRCVICQLILHRQVLRKQLAG